MRIRLGPDPTVYSLLAGVVTLVASCRPTSAATTVALTHVSVRVDPDADRSEEQTILIAGDSIVALGPAADVDIPPGTRVIDGAGLTAVAGLVDAHVHLTDDAERWLPAFLIAGVTTVLSMDGTDRTLALRAEAVGRPWPTIYTASSLARQPAIVTPEDAERFVAAQRAAGTDFIKVYDPLTPDAYERLLERATEAGLPVVGHIPRGVGIDRIIARGQALVGHAEELLYGGLTPLDTAGNQRRLDALVRAGIAVSPTLAMFRNVVAQWGRPEVAEARLREPDAAVLSPGLRRAWSTANRYVHRRGNPPESTYRFLRALTGDLAVAGVELMVGTDAPTPLMLPGASFHDEVDILREVGVSETAILRAATETPGRFVAERVPHPGRRFGVIRPGYRADLVLVRGDPLDGLRRLRVPEGVMLRGVWYDQRALDSLRQALIRDAANGESEPMVDGVAIPADSLRRFVGEYRSTAPPLDLAVALAEGALVVGEVGEAPFILTPIGPTRFQFDAGGVAMILEFTDGGAALRVTRGDELLWTATRVRR